MTLIQLLSVIDIVGTDSIDINNEYHESIGELLLIEFGKYKNKRVSMVGVESGQMYIDLYIDD